MKKILLFCISFLIISTVSAYAQETEGERMRSLGFYMQIASGQLAPTNPSPGSTANRDQFFEGNEAEFGITYSQNFAKVPWLSMGGSLIYVANSIPAYTGGNLTGFVPAGPSAQNFRANMWINMPYFMLLLDSRGLLGAYTSHSFDLGKAGSVAVGADLELFMTGNAWYGNPNPESGLYPGDPGPGGTPEEPIPSGHIAPIYLIDYFGIWATYSVPLPVEGMGFSTSAQVRLGANAWNDYHSVEFDPLAALELRWNNTVSYAVDGWNFFLQLRASGYGLAGAMTPVLKARDKDPLFVLQTIAGASYSFDLSKI